MQKIYEYKKKEFPPYEIRKVSGHNGVLGNEIADALATNNIKKIEQLKKRSDLIWNK